MASATSISHWQQRLKGDPLPWLLDASEPAVRHRVLRELLDRGPDDPEVGEARAQAMTADPIAGILAAQNPEGWWARPGGGYSPKYASTVWALIWLDQLGADGTDPRIRLACEYLLQHTSAPNGGISCTNGDHPPTSSSVLHCLNGNVARALIGFGWLADPRVQRALAWEAAAITGSGAISFARSTTSGPGFRCSINERLPCGWGATKGVMALARVPVGQRTPAISEALDQGVEFLLSVDPATARYPMGWRNTEPNRNWFKLAFPSGYIADVLQVMEAVAEAGAASDPRLANAIEWLLEQQDAHGRWKNQYRYSGREIVPIDHGRVPSRWVTLRACRVLKMVAEA